MNIDYIVISSDDSHYIDFYKPVARMWKNLGFKTLMLHITDDESTTHNEYGIYKRIKKHKKYPTGWQAQLVRLYSYEMFSNSNLLLSDIDMLPLSKEYFTSNSLDISDDCVLNYSGQPYDDSPNFPMCYILGSGKVMKDVLKLPETFESFLEQVENECSVQWNSDENYLYNHLSKYQKLISLPKRNCHSRIDRSNWNYDINRLLAGEYFDSHLLRPYKKFATEIDNLINCTLYRHNNG
jgi:hypothetical protein